MPFEALTTDSFAAADAKPNPKRIAVIGAGISGMGAAFMLGKDHHVTLFESEKRLGGHARTVLAGKNGDRPVDTGFIVFNHANYPYLSALFDQLNVPIVKSTMSFGTSIDGGRLEYALTSLDALFAQRRNVLSPGFLGMVRDIMKFNKHGPGIAASDKTLTLGAFLARLGTGDWFRDYYLLPFSGAIWSTPKDRVMDFPAYAMMDFFANHALLSATGQHQWYTVQGGSTQYVQRLEQAMRSRRVTLRTGAAVRVVTRTAGQVQVRSHGGTAETFDEVVFATHSDDSLRLLGDASPHERSALGAIAYQPNDIVLHADATLMPKRRKVWSSWVYTEDPGADSDRIDLTYWMNSLQPIPMDDLHFVTLNTKRRIREELIYDQVTLRHPVYDLPALAAQKALAAANGANHTWFCGAWMKNGFHEDGLSSAVDVAQAFSGRANIGMVAA